MVLRDVNYLESHSGRDFDRDRLSCVLYRARSRGTRDRRARAQSPDLASIRVDGHGRRHLEHALRRHAGVPDADRDSLRRADRAHIGAHRDRRRVPRSLHGEPRGAPRSPIARGRSDSGYRHRWHALYRNGGDAHARVDSLRSAAPVRVDRDRHLRVVRGALARLPLPKRRNAPRPLAPRRERARHGRSHLPACTTLA